MKKIFIALIIGTLSFSAQAADRKVIDVDWTKRGLKVDYPLYKYQTRQVNRQVRVAERMPNKIVKQSFRKADKAINKKLNKMFDF